MKLNDARENYYFFSGKTSELIRQLGLAGIAIIWIFKRDVAGLPKVPPELIRPLWLIALGLAFDMLQYATSTLIWGTYQRHKELAGVNENAEFKAPRWFNWPGITLITLKVVVIAFAYVYIIRFLVCTIL